MTRTARLIATCGLALLTAAAGAAPRLVPGREEARRLAADDFVTRQTTARSLAATPDAALLPWLADVARGADAEAALHAVRIMERWLTSAPLPLAEQVEDRLDELSQDAAITARQAARDALVVHRKLRQERAVETLRALGAKVDFGPDQDALHIAFNVTHEEPDYRERIEYVSGLIAATHPPAEISPDDELHDPGEQGPVISREQLPQTPRQIFLTSQWTGGDAGARQLRRLAGIDALHVYVVRGCQTEVTSVQQATAELPEVAVQERGPCLGVGSDRWRNEAVVGTVLAGGAAAAAGIEPLDLVVAVQGRRVDSFQGLIRVVADFEPGETIDLTVVRGLEPLSIQVTLGNWIEADTESQLWKAPEDALWGPGPRRIVIPPNGLPAVPPNQPQLPPFFLPQLLPPNLPIQPLDPLPPRIEAK